MIVFYDFNHCHSSALLIYLSTILICTSEFFACFKSAILTFYHLICLITHLIWGFFISLSEDNCNPTTTCRTATKPLSVNTFHSLTIFKFWQSDTAFIINLLDLQGQIICVAVICSFTAFLVYLLYLTAYVLAWK